MKTGRAWPTSTNEIETLTLRPGLQLILSQIGAGSSCAFHHVEADDVFGMGFHLLGGARFDLGETSFATVPLEVHAASASTGSISNFELPGTGFRTVSLRFAPAAAQELFDRHGQPALVDLAAEAGRGVAARRLAPLDSAGVAIIDAMFAAPGDSVRPLFLEGCALSLLASQLGAAERLRDPLPERGLIAARDHLDAHLDAPPSIIQLARIAGINDFKLKRAFKAAFGTTLYGYVRQRRMERAAGDLHAGLSVALAARQAGYECPRCFADAFRRHYGILPSAVTRAALASTPARHG